MQTHPPVVSNTPSPGLSYTDLSNHLFWDVDRTKVDFDQRKAWVIERVLSHGMLSDWDTIKKYYSEQVIRQVVLELRYLDKYSLHFCAAYFNEPIQHFRCYTYGQSNPGHWDY